ncbi:hypothetical protein ACFOLK_07110 [Marinococcus halophilus]|uniref:Uncharacterized protein n=1 Tax=Marinococcus halophilus TaxID=1371 RepID=A0A510Y7H1_MARHA|nr:hypothetical protein [Marinococcus halophilus]GEK59315.1 hypothetical protein MHA01_22200 [Marinococcus halophilus]
MKKKNSTDCPKVLAELDEKQARLDKYRKEIREGNNKEVTDLGDLSRPLHNKKR